MGHVAEHQQVDDVLQQETDVHGRLGLVADRSEVEHQEHGRPGRR